MDIPQHILEDLTTSIRIFNEKVTELMEEYRCEVWAKCCSALTPFGNQPVLRAEVKKRIL